MIGVSNTTFFGALQRLGIPEKEAAAIVEDLNIIRPYGTLGSIFPNNPLALPFGSARYPELFSMIDRIRTFTESEALHDKDVLREAITAAAMIIFLGFGFHPQNLQLLSLPKTLPFRPAKVLATVHGVSEPNLPELKAALAKRLRVEERKIETYPMTASQILILLRMKITMSVG